jgi:hypothetical protein
MRTENFATLINYRGLREVFMYKNVLEQYRTKLSGHTAPLLCLYNYVEWIQRLWSYREFTNPVPTTADYAKYVWIHMFAVMKAKEAERIQSNVTESFTILLTVLSAGNTSRGPVVANCTTLYQLLRLTVRYIHCVRTQYEAERRQNSIVMLPP